MLVSGDQLVAIIPRDESGTANAIRTNSFFNFSIPAEVYIGSYLIRGKVMSGDKNLRVFSGYVGFPVQEAEIHCLLPGAQLVGFTAPYVLVLSRHKQMIVPIT